MCSKKWGPRFFPEKLIPIVWDMPPSELPGWTKEYQALDLRGVTIEQVRSQLSAIVGRIKSDKFWFFATLLIGGVLIFTATRK